MTLWTSNKELRQLRRVSQQLGATMQGAARVDEQAARLRGRSGARDALATATPPATDGAAPAAPQLAAYNQTVGVRPPTRSPATGAVGTAQPAPLIAGGPAAPAARRAGAWWARDAEAGAVTDAELLAAAAAGG